VPPHRFSTGCRTALCLNRHWIVNWSKYGVQSEVSETIDDHRNALFQDERHLAPAKRQKNGGLPAVF
jgi:hypothetical protein